MKEPFLSTINEQQEAKIQVIIEEDDSPSEQKVNPAWENNDFKGVFFVEFLGYFIMDLLLGPIAWIIYKFLPNGIITASNLKILSPWGCYPLSRLIIYLFRVYVIFVTFWMERTWVEFYLLVFTEISLLILFSTYYSTFRHSEIIKFKTVENSNKSTNDMKEIFQNLIEKSKMRFLKREKLKEEFPEIDFNMFYFYFKSGTQPKINFEMKGRESIQQNNIIKNNIEMMEKYNDTVMIDGVILTNYIARLCDDEKQFNRRARFAKFISRLLVFIKLVAPFVADLITLDVTFEHFNDLNYLCYSTTMFCLVILIFRSCLIYDTIFLGLISYLYKLKVLNFLHNLLKEEPNTLYINLAIPENLTNWYNMRKILARLNAQFYSLVDIVLSYLLLYIVIACIYILVTVFLGIHFSLVDNFFGDKTFKVITDSYKVVIIVVLYYGLKIGYQINEYFDFNRAILTRHNDIITNMANYSEFYLNNVQLVKSNIDPNDRYMKYLINIYELIGEEDFNVKFISHIERLKDQVQIVIDQLAFEAEMYPHKLLGIQTNEDFVLKLISVVSIIGVSNAKEFL